MYFTTMSEDGISSALFSLLTSCGSMIGYNMSYIAKVSEAC